MVTTSRDPETVKAKITRAMQARDPGKALSLARDLIKLPRATVHDCLGVVQMAKQCYDTRLVLLALRRAVAKSGDDLPLAVNLAEEEVFAGHSEIALKLLVDAETRATTCDDLVLIGIAYGRLGEGDRAKQIYARAVEMSPEDPAALGNLAASLSFDGKTDEAEGIYNRLIAKGDTDPRVWFNRSALRRQTAEHNHIDELKAALDAVPKGQDTSYLHYALGKECEDLGDDAASFASIRAAASDRRAQMPYRVEAELAELEKVKAAYSADFFAGVGEGASNDEAIFILGMPRSGSTLIEKFVSAHSQVFAAGELHNFRRAVRNSISDLALKDGLVGPLDRVGLSLRLDYRKVGNLYIDSTRPRTGHTPRFIDKNPANYLNVGLIAAALPNAKIIYSARDPMDVCYAMYKQPFIDDYLFTYDLDDLARFYNGFDALMSHWMKVLPDRIIPVQYEALVNGPGEVMPDLISRLGLPWEEACLDHRTNREAARTASADQVRRPLYNSSIGRWKRFEDELAPLRKALESGGIAVA